MNFFLKKLTILISSVVLMLIIYGFLANLVFVNGSYYKSQWINKLTNENTDYIFIGNSRASQLELEKDKVHYLNLGQDGIGLKLTYAQLYLFFKNNNKSDFVLLEGDYLSLNKLDETRRSPRWLPFFSDNVIYNLLKDEYSSFKYHQYFPFYNYILFKFDWGIPQFLNSLLNLKSSPWGDLGYNNVCHNYVDFAVSGSVDFNKYPPNWYWINKINSLCIKNNSQLIIFTAPYFNMKDKITITDDFYNSLRNKQIHYMDFSRTFELNKSLFRDNRHLN